jgi:hypothetical protein
MHMTGHNTPAINFQPLLALAVFYTINPNPAILFTYKNIEPVNGGVRNKI